MASNSVRIDRNFGSPTKSWARHRPYRIGGALGRLARALVAMHQADQEQRHLALLDEHILADIGMHRDAARMSVAKTLWGAMLLG